MSEIIESLFNEPGAGPSSAEDPKRSNDDGEREDSQLDGGADEEEDADGGVKRAAVTPVENAAKRGRPQNAGKRKRERA